MLQERLQWGSINAPEVMVFWSRLSIDKVLALTYAWAHKFITTQAVHETSLDDETTSTETVIDWYNYCREACAHRIKNHHAGPIGRPGNTVEIHESKFEKIKYHRGRKSKETRGAGERSEAEQSVSTNMAFVTVWFLETPGTELTPVKTASERSWS